MNLVFTNAALLPLALLIALPLIIHLMARARPKAYLFSTVEFISRIVRETSRIRRPRSWLLLLLRTLLVAALVGVFLMPELQFPVPLAEAFAKKNVVVLVDATASMAAREGGSSRFAAARARAAEIISGLSSSDTANVVWVRNPAQAVYPTLGVNHSGLQDELKSGQVVQEAADIAGAFSLAISLLERAEGAKEIYLISDFQETNWSAFEPPSSEGIQLVMLPVATRDVGNQAIITLRVAPQRPLAGQQTEVFCELANYSDLPALRKVFLRTGSIAESKDVRLEPWSRQSVFFPQNLQEPGDEVITVTLSEDDFPADNSRHAIVGVRDSINVAVTGSNLDACTVWARALGSVSWIAVSRPAALNRALEENPDALFIGGWDGNGSQQLADAIANGLTVVVLPAPGCEVAELQALLALEETGGVFEEQRLATPQKLRIADSEHPVLEVFAGGSHGDPSASSFDKRLVIDLETEALRTVLDYADGMPALQHAELAAGNLWLWNMALNPLASEFAARMEVVPLLGEMVFLGLGGDGSSGQFNESGWPLQLVIEQEVLQDDIRVLSGMGEIAVRPGADESQFETVEGVGPGVYEWLLQSKSIRNMVVNFPESESDLRLSKTPGAALGDATALPAGQSVSKLREGTRLWPWLLAMAVAMVVVESIVVRVGGAQ